MNAISFSQNVSVLHLSLYIGQIVTFKDVQGLSYKVAVFCLLLGDSDT